MATLLDCAVVTHNPQDKVVDKAVIWLHGLGANGHDFAVAVPHLKLPDDLAVRFVFPHAPSRPVTINGGFVMPSWYDIYERSLDRKVDKEQIGLSTQMINELIDEQIAKGVPSQSIIIAGFSQGGAVAYHTVLTNDKRLAGLLAMSTYFATTGEINEVGVNRDIPVRIDHGIYDDTVPPSLGSKAKQQLEALGMRPTLHHYPMAHQASLVQLAEIGQWLTEVFKNA